MPGPLPHLVVWLLIGVVEVAFALQSMAPPGGLEIGLNFGGLVILAILQWRLAPAGQLRTTALPAVAAVALPAVLLHHPPGLLSTFAFVIGAAALTWTLLKILHERMGENLVLGVLLALGAGVLQRVVVLSASDVRDPRGQVVAELASLPELLSSGGSIEAQGPPLVLISIDTLRADDAVGMRAVQRVAETGVLHPQALATSSWTLPSMTSMHTGAAAHEHGAGSWPGGVVSTPHPELPRLAEQLQGAGYRTMAVVTNPYCSSDMGFDRGFDDFLHANERAAHRLSLTGWPAGPRVWEGELVVARALARVEELPERGWFLWVHLLDVHLPYRHVEAGHVGSEDRAHAVLNRVVFTEAEQQELRAGYRHEVAVVDGLLEQLLDALPATANVLIAADHGEEFWEHGGVEHGHSHHGEVTDVALALGGPDVPDLGFVGGGVVSLTDVAPTLRALAGLEAGGHDLRTEAPLDRIVLAQGNKYARWDRSARQGALRLVWRGGEEPVLYDLAVDPDELHPEPVPPGHVLVEALEAAPAIPGEAADHNTEALKALGYVDD